tara:strand:- start:185 stop:388 length:204 start_codon:yes stop_codon:yes gene_type:complete
MKKVLVLGSGAREVAITRGVSQSSIKNAIFCISKDINPQINDICEDYYVCDVSDVANVVSYSKKKRN